jgi:hypothetical protein
LPEQAILEAAALLGKASEAVSNSLRSAHVGSKSTGATLAAWLH